MNTIVIGTINPPLCRNMPEIAIAWRFSSQKVHHWDLGTTWDFTMVFLSEFSGMNSWDLVCSCGRHRNSCLRRSSWQRRQLIFPRPSHIAVTTLFWNVWGSWLFSGFRDQQTSIQHRKSAVRQQLGSKKSLRFEGRRTLFNDIRPLLTSKIMIK